MERKNYRKIKYLLLSGLITTPALIGGSIVLTQKMEKKYLLFDNKVFQSEKALQDFLSVQKLSTFANVDAKSYFFDNQIFNTTQQFSEYLTNKFNIDEKLTNKIPGDHTINSSGELDEKVLIDNNDQAINVYKGKNGVAYLDRKAALETFLNYKKIYTLEGKDFDSSNEVKNFLKESKLKELEKLDAKPETVYKNEYVNGALMQDKDTITNWLRRNIKNGFLYEGKIFSDYNYQEFLNYFQNLNQNILDDNITTVHDADKSAYWINLDNNQNPGFFIGPKYVETTSELNPVINSDFKTIDSFTPNLISGIASLSVFNKIIDADYSSKVNKSFLNNDLDSLKSLLEKLKDEEIISPDIRDEFTSTLIKTETPLLQEIVANSLLDLDKIEGEEFTDFHRLLVIAKRIMTPVRVYSGLDPEEIEKVLKDLIIAIITSNTKMEKNFGLKEILENVKLESIIDLFLNPDAFYQNNEDKVSALQLIKNIDGTLNSLVTSLTTPGKIKEKMDNLKKAYQENIKSEKDLTSAQQLAQQEIKSTLELSENVEFISNSLGIEFDEDSSKNTFAVPPLLLIKAIGFAWEMLNTFSFVSIKTTEYKIDDYQSIYYIVPTFKLPILNIESPVDQPTLKVNKLSDAPLKFILPTDKNGESVTVYELEGKYYLKLENAKEELRNLIYLNPEKYIPCKKIFTSIFENDHGYELPPEISEARIIKKEKDKDLPGAIPYDEYLKKLEDEKNKYVEYLFTIYFSTKKSEHFVDGYGNYFETREEALESLEKNLNNSELIEKHASYLYITRSGKKVYKNSEKEITDFIKKNELIDSKTVMSTDLITKAIYDEISNYSNIYFTIQELDYYGEKKYFMNFQQAWNYLLNHLDYKVNYYRANFESHAYKDHLFKSLGEFDTWVKENTKLINAFEVQGKEMINNE